MAQFFRLKPGFIFSPGATITFKGTVTTNMGFTGYLRMQLSIYFNEQPVQTKEGRQNISVPSAGTFPISVSASLREGDAIGGVLPYVALFDSRPFFLADAQGSPPGVFMGYWSNRPPQWPTQKFTWTLSSWHTNGGGDWTIVPVLTVKEHPSGALLFEYKDSTPLGYIDMLKAAGPLVPGSNADTFVKQFRAVLPEFGLS